MNTTHAQQGDTLDDICWRHYGRSMGVVEAVIETNPGITRHGPVLPTGTPVKLPSVAPQPTATGVVNLWD